jgi:hypothetical protein
VRFTAGALDTTRVSVEFAYRLNRRSPLTPILDALFVRRAMQAWLRATLARFAAATR